jgi:hypothetical protein
MAAGDLLLMPTTNHTACADGETATGEIAYQKLERLSVLLTLIGFVGLWLCKQVEQHLGLTDRQWMEAPAGRVAVWLCSGCFTMGLMVLLPVSLYFKRKAGVPLPGPRVPNWITWPVVAVVLMCFGALFLVIVAAALSGSPQS